MPTEKKAIRTGIMLAVLLLSLEFSAPASRAQQPALRISSPSAGAVVAPGDSLHVVVIPAEHMSFSVVGVVFTNNLGATQIRKEPPYEFSITIPANARSGKYLLTALGRSPAIGATGSLPVAIYVERPEAPIKLQVEPSRLDLTAFGERLPLSVRGTFSDGSSTDVTRSSHLHFLSANQSIASVDNQGVVTAVHAGRTSVEASYGAAHITIPVITEPPAFLLSADSLDFGVRPSGAAGPEKIITLRNTQQEPLRVTGVDSRGDFSLQQNCTRQEIPPGGACEISVQFAPAQAGLREGELAISTRADSAQTILRLTGTSTASSQ